MQEQIIVSLMMLTAEMIILNSSQNDEFSCVFSIHKNDCAFTRTTHFFEMKDTFTGVAKSFIGEKRKAHFFKECNCFENLLVVI